MDQATSDRFATLVVTDSISRANYDHARFTLAADKNKLESLQQQAQVQLARLAGNADIAVTEHPQYLQAKAQVDEAQRQLDHTVVRAPFDGVATQVDALQPGAYLVSQTAALTNTGAIGLVSTDKRLGRRQHEGNRPHLCEAGQSRGRHGRHLSGPVWSGTVESIAPAGGSEFSILPAQNASGNWVKVVQRIPVRIRIDHEPGIPRCAPA